MVLLTNEYIRDCIADSAVIYQRGIKIYEYGSYICSEADHKKGQFLYDIDGTYGDYTARIHLHEDGVELSCDCPYPGKGCKHLVAALLDIKDQIKGFKPQLKNIDDMDSLEPTEPYLTEEEIKHQALEDRKKRANQEKFEVILGDMYKGEHLLETNRGKQYVITLHDPENNRGHCSCPDFFTNRLNTCKHLIYLDNHIKKNKDFKKRIAQESFPFIDIYWDSAHDKPRLFSERPASEISDIQEHLSEYFDSEGLFAKNDLNEFLTFAAHLNGHKKIRVQEHVFKRLDDHLLKAQMKELSHKSLPAMDVLKTNLYPYQKVGVEFGLYKQGVLIGDEMGLGKTLQAIALGILKKEIFGFTKVLVVTLASLKEQWKREIERFTDEKALVIAGSRLKRQASYNQEDSLFKITNYEAVLRDVTIISRFKPDLLILDEAQRIKNFTTKTAEAVKSLPRKHALVLTGTPLENKLEDVYSIVQFLDPHMLSPLWNFAAEYFMLSRDKKGKVLGYRNLDHLNKRLKSIVIRRRKEEVLSDLPDEVVNNYFLDLAEPQQKMHAGFLQSLLPLLNKKFLTPVDIKRIQTLLLMMRMVCDSTYLIDRKTNISPKLKELAGILDELVVQNGRKAVIFSEWTTMTFLIAKHLSEAGIQFVELSGKVPVNKRQLLIDEFTNNPECKVFLSTDAGGTGLNLQAADCVINFELPWNPAKMNQRIGRVNRIGQKSKCINVVNLITKLSIEEKILASIQIKTDLFKGVFDGGIDKVEFSQKKRTELLNKLREMMGEEAAVEKTEARDLEEIPEDTPHYLNPKVLQEEKKCLYYEEENTDDKDGDKGEDKAKDKLDEEFDLETSSSETESPGTLKTADTPEKEQEFSLGGQSPEKLEEVLNSGLQFIGGLLEMATGEKIKSTDTDNEKRMLRIDKETGEVTMKFKLPGF